MILKYFTFMKQFSLEINPIIILRFKEKTKIQIQFPVDVTLFLSQTCMFVKLPSFTGLRLKYFSLCLGRECLTDDFSCVKCNCTTGGRENDDIHLFIFPNYTVNIQYSIQYASKIHMLEIQKKY